MGYSTLIFHTILCLSMFSCGSSHKKDTTNKSTDSTKKSVVYNDTTPKPPLPSPGLPPNTVRLKGQILKIQSSEKHDMMTLRLKIIQVLVSGSDAPLLSPQDTLLASTPVLPDSLVEGKTCVGLFQHRQVLAQFKKKTPQWRLTKIEHDQDQK